MDLFKNLKKLQKIEPDVSYAAKSKQIVLSEKPKFLSSSVAWQLIRQSLESGLSVALVGVLLVLLLGGFSVFKSLTPLQTQNFDPSSLVAEAQNIDIQIQLADLQYIQTFKKIPSDELSKAPKKSAPDFESKPKVSEPSPEKTTSTDSESLPNPEETELIEKAIEILLK